MRVRKSLKSHAREVTALAWHPKFDNILVSGGQDNPLYWWDLDQEVVGPSAVSERETKGEARATVLPCQLVRGAHEGGTYDLAFHPFSHVLASCGRDGNVKLWSRARPGDSLDDNSERAGKGVWWGYKGMNPAFDAGKGMISGKGESAVIDGKGEVPVSNTEPVTNTPTPAVAVDTTRAVKTAISRMALGTGMFKEGESLLDQIKNRAAAEEAEHSAKRVRTA